MIFWITGCPCSGKTFIGDYLELHEGFVSIDGDTISYSEDATDQATWKDMLEAFGHWFKKEEAPDALWQAHYRSIYARAVAQSAEGKNVVVTFALFPRKVRDFVRSLVPEAAQELRFVWLGVSEDELVRRNFKRLSTHLASVGTTHEQFWAGGGDANVEAARRAYGESWSYEAFARWQKEVVYAGTEPFSTEELETDCVVVDNEDLESGAGIDQLRTAVGLAARTEAEKHSLDAQAIAEMNFERYKKLPAARKAAEGEQRKEGSSGGGAL